MMIAYEGLPKEFSLCEPISPEAFKSAIQKVGLQLPDDYLEFLSAYNGGEGFLGENYLIIWAAEELWSFNLE